MPQSLPLEITDLIIDHLASQPSVHQAIISCSLASRTLSHRARQYLFRSIEIFSSNDYAISLRLRDLMKSDPTFCNYIRELKICLMYRPIVIETTVETGLPDILEMLCEAKWRGDSDGLTSLTVESVGDWYPWGRLSNQFLTALDKLIHGSGLDEGQRLTSLQSLHVSNFVGFPVSFVVRMAGSIRELEIRHIGFMELPDMPNQHLQQLSVSGVEESDHIFPSRAAPAEAPSLKKLTFVLDYLEEPYMMPVTLLTKMVFSHLGYWKFEGDLTFPTLPLSFDHASLNLLKISCLRHLTIAEWIRDDQSSFSSSSVFLSLISDPRTRDYLVSSLEHLELIFRIRTLTAGRNYSACFAEKNFWVAIDKCLSSSEMSDTVNKVDLAVYILYKGPIPISDENEMIGKVKEDMKPFFTGLSGKEKIRFDFKVEMNGYNEVFGSQQR
ncbi:hypothetical protein CPB84DRAFT_1787709 [Gymnopilus junonius]|uniref:Uncharacterized protein n=1 Tax=Gymnopilus junonius TaxID=109634 RepID=A0A9P5TIW9_GYMJU|nr:hypothetical protein CPB84DRAFT_1787709 [Gymnopilus junonius]